MSNIIAFPITHPGDVVCDRIEDISNWLIAIHDELAKATRASVSLPETASTNRPAEQSWS